MFSFLRMKGVFFYLRERPKNISIERLDQNEDKMTFLRSDIVKTTTVTPFLIKEAKCSI